MQVNGSVVIVAGGASGLGLATVRALAGAGATVVVLDVPGSAGAQIATELGEQVHFHAADIGDPAQVRAAVEAAAALGELRAAVNTAGISRHARVLAGEDDRAFDAFASVVRVNLVGSFHFLRLTARAMAELGLQGEERGVFVNTASVAAFDGIPGQAAYSASKGGIVAMTLPIARELRDAAIRAVTIAPGIFDTPMLGAAAGAREEDLVAQVQHPHRRGRPEEFAALVLHVLANPMLNGETIRLDAGLRVGP
jgi:NAD(P)-dependent dehydrogenase (short-subunit alcohol dehydrogenase family)